MLESQKKLHVALVGCGHWGRFILRDLKSLGVSVFVVARSKASKTRAAQGKADLVVPSIKDLPAVDGYVVATPIKTHYEVICRILKKDSKAPIFCEKSLTDNVQKAKRLAKIAPTNLFVMDKWRYHGAIEEMARVVKSKKYGKPSKFYSMRLTPDKTKGDLLWRYLPHEIAMIYEIFGILPKAKYVEVKSNKAFHAAFGQKPSFEIDIKKDGQSKREIRLFLDKATVIMDDSYSNSMKIEVNGETSTLKFENEMPLKKELSVFLDFIRGGNKPKSDVMFGLRTVEMIENIKKIAFLK